VLRKLFLGLVIASVAAMVVRSLPDLRRYLEIRRM
jgi:uncharacterized protein DUF6893